MTMFEKRTVYNGNLRKKRTFLNERLCVSVSTFISRDTLNQVLSVQLSSRGKLYEYFLPDFDWKNDQLIMDFRDEDGVSSEKSNIKTDFCYFSGSFG